jgi:hypothetical protein
LDDLQVFALNRFVDSCRCHFIPKLRLRILVSQLQSQKAPTLKLPAVLVQ